MLVTKDMNVLEWMKGGLYTDVKLLFIKPAS